MEVSIGKIEELMSKSCDEMARLQDLNAELLEALEQIRGQMKEANAQSSYGSEMDKCINAALELADAAIKKAKG
jgi:DNA-binding transcriptional MerR regulator